MNSPSLPFLASEPPPSAGLFSLFLSLLALAFLLGIPAYLLGLAAGWFQWKHLAERTRARLSAANDALRSEIRRATEEAPGTDTAPA